MRTVRPGVSTSNGRLHLKAVVLMVIAFIAAACTLASAYGTQGTGNTGGTYWARVYQNSDETIVYIDATSADVTAFKTK